MSERDPEIDGEGMRLSFSNLLTTGNNSDLTLIVGLEKKQFKVHKLIVGANSIFFQAACGSNFVESRTNIINLPEQSPDVIKLVLDFLYTGKYRNTDGVEMDIEVFLSSVYLGIESLKKFSLYEAAIYLDKDPEDIMDVILEDQIVSKILKRVYTQTSRFDRQFSEFQYLLEAMMRGRLGVLINDEQFQKLLRESSELATELLCWTVSFVGRI